MLQFNCGKGLDFDCMNYYTCFLVAIDGGSMLLQYICTYLPDYMS
jgi:hypothetical protein